VAEKTTHHFITEYKALGNDLSIYMQAALANVGTH
jgi:hypothetical protein